MHFFFLLSNLLDQSKEKINKVFLVKQQTNLVKTWLGEGGGSETKFGAFLLTPWLLGTKYPKDITLCESNTVMVLIIAIMIDIHVSIYLPKN